MITQDKSMSRSQVLRVSVGIALSAIVFAGLLVLLPGSNGDTAWAIGIGGARDISAFSYLDPTFGVNGILTTSISSDDRSQSVVIQPDGKIVVAGKSGDFPGSDFALIRYTATGTLDTDFGVGGIVTTSFGNNSNDSCHAVALQSNSKIVAVGESWDGARTIFVVVRYNGDGSLDADFGSGGVVTTSVSGNDAWLSVVVQPDGKIVASGTSWNNTESNPEFAVARYTDNGALDDTFGSGGVVITPIGSTSWDYGNSVALQSDNKIVVGGGSSGVMAVVRYNTDGGLDTTFGINGIITTSVGSWASVQSVAIQPDGKIIAAGNGGNFGDWDISLTRYTITGTLDTDFGMNGVVITSVGPGADYGSSVAIDPDGRIVVAGRTFNGDDDDFAVVRYSSVGIPDPSFGINGIVITPLGLGDDTATSVALQLDGKIVVSGFSYGHTGNSFAIVRYWIPNFTEFVFLPIVQR